ncbi:MAG: hypothetical protein QNJ29_06760 [Rhizobiaceae bacterium]|nr:hypothetical protein [Rhizobiaceae bacterium]
MIGDYFAIRFAKKANGELLKKSMIAIGLGMSAYYFWSHYG